MSEIGKTCVVACRVLAPDIDRLAGRLALPLCCTYLEGGLHRHPGELRRRLQAAIDRASAGGRYERIVLGYGICGRGTVGLHARQIPLVLPRVHDCIALFLGSDRAYKHQFARCPGTYYISAGWYEEQVEPHTQEPSGAAAELLGQGRAAELVARYGQEHGRAICEFLHSWQRNYQRAVFIDTGAGTPEKYAAYTQRLAHQLGWRYERIAGDLSLLEKLLTARGSSEEVLVVPAGMVTVHDAVRGRLQAAPVGRRPPLGQQPVPSAAAPPETPPPRDARESVPAAAFRHGLGIDAGGTYTDVVIYDFARAVVGAKAKALTTKWDYTIGIKAALQQLPADSLGQVDLVVLSTTLATNAIVEGRGQRVGLFVMPPPGSFDAAEMGHDPTVVLAGRLAIDGRKIESVDAAQVRAAARDMVARRGVQAFAVSGFAGAINPAHELQVRRILRQETHLPVTCGHELSQLLNFKTRALTAVLNARIIPYLARLLQDAAEVLHRWGVTAPIMVVKGDGSLMSAGAARLRPVETILSGPAASVAGARHLTDRRDAIVTDMGGTTTDSAALRDGHVWIDEGGTRVGGVKTHVRALHMRTVGLGGDSQVVYRAGRFRIGPRRVAPVAYLGSVRADAAARTLAWLEPRVDDLADDTGAMQIVALTGYGDHFDPDVQERRVLQALRERPRSLAELGVCAEFGLWTQLRLQRLEEHQVIERFGLTPTDLLHAGGHFARWDAAAARRMAEMTAHVAGLPLEELVERIIAEVTQRLAVEILKKQLDDEVEPDVMDDCAVCQALLRNLLQGGNGYRVEIRLHHPVIGIGAPVRFFLPRAAALLGTQAVIPEHAEVANAVGAVTSSVRVTRQVLVRPDEQGGFAVENLPGAARFASFEEAQAHAVRGLEGLVRRQARRAGTSATAVELTTEDRVSRSADGTEIFLGRVITAQLSGQPDRAATAG